MHRPNFSMPLSSTHLQVPKEQAFGPPILVTTPSEEVVNAPFDSFAGGLAPMVISSPRTPLPKIPADYEGDLWKRHSLCSDDDEEMTRPSSAASMYSSSSACSFGSMTSFNSFPASAESPRQEKGNAFANLAPVDQEEADTSMELTDSQKTPRARRPHKQDSTRDADWSKTFDLHLWGAYISYQSNPTVTPFYVPPGGCPPIGVCIRVAREAKRTWRVPKTVQETDLTSPTERLSRTNSDTLLPVDARIGEGSLRKRRPSRGHAFRKGREQLPRSWPYSEAATRQRLRILSRRITENPHLQTRHGRLASPIHMKQFAPPRKNIAEDSQYSTRSLSFSLITSTSESMQSDGPLASLSRPFDSEEDGLRMPQGDVPLAHDVFKPTLEPSYEVDDELDAAIAQSIIPSAHRRNLSSASAHRRSGSKNSILHRKTEGSNGVGHRRNTSTTGAKVPEQTSDTFATPRKRTRLRSSSDATIRSIPRMLCLGSPFGAVEEENNEASRHARRSAHKRHQSLQSPLSRRPAAPPALMPAFDFTKQEAYQNAIKQQEQEKLAQQSRPPSSLDGKKNPHFFDDLFTGNASRTNLSERSSTPSVNGSDGASIRVPSKKTRSRGISFTDKLRGNTNECITPSRRPQDQLKPERPSVLKRLGSPFRDSEFTPLDSTLNQSQITLPDAPAQDAPPALGSAFTSPPRQKKRDTAVTPSRERGILGFGLGFFRRGKKETSQQH
ncbi:hypothetical protein ABW19_dt0206756 [Dactylella cylindrospora]|nr:hypothetical protein ABW19_dt0206756 [Dactylella cylindrospora]